jgi:chromosome segregation ATPase
MTSTQTSTPRDAKEELSSQIKESKHQVTKIETQIETKKEIITRTQQEVKTHEKEVLGINKKMKDLKKQYYEDRTKEFIQKTKAEFESLHTSIESELEIDVTLLSFETRLLEKLSSELKNAKISQKLPELETVYLYNGCQIDVKNPKEFENNELFKTV